MMNQRDHSLDAYEAGYAIYQLATVLEGIRNKGVSPAGWGNFYSMCVEPMKNVEEKYMWNFMSPVHPVGVGVSLYDDRGVRVDEIRVPEVVDVIKGESTFLECMERWAVMRDRVMGTDVTHPRLVALRDHFMVPIASLEYHLQYWAPGTINSD
jgi:hypothetical protein